MLEFFNIDRTFFIGLLVVVLCYLFLFIWLKSTGTGLINTFDFVNNWILFPFYPVANSFEPLTIDGF